MGLDIEFPLFRKYSNNKSYFKVLDRQRFEEITTLGSHYWVHHFEAKILPDRYLVLDIIARAGGRWEAISETEYDEFKLRCQKEYNLRV